jgi:hypothetical protein
MVTRFLNSLCRRYGAEALHELSDIPPGQLMETPALQIGYAGEDLILQAHNQLLGSRGNRPCRRVTDLSSRVAHRSAA